MTAAEPGANLRRSEIWRPFKEQHNGMEVLLKPSDLVTSPCSPKLGSRSTLHSWAQRSGKRGKSVKIAIINRKMPESVYGPWFQLKRSYVRLIVG